MLAIAFNTHIDSSKLADWHEVIGELQYAYTRNVSAPTARPSRWDRLRLILKYTYNVRGIKYSGDRLMLLDIVHVDEHRLARLHPGTIFVYVNPNDPSESLLYKDLSNSGPDSLWCQAE